jgi:outer membrane lipoprotein SlyB
MNYMNMKKTIMVFAAIAALVLAGCATTTQINFTGTEAPKGELKYAIIAASSMSGDSVLQRFYAEYPREKYQIVSCQLVSKNYLPILGGIGGGLFGALIGLPMANSSDNMAAGWGIGMGAPIVSGLSGYIIGDYFKDKYVVAYVEIGGE